MRKACIIFVGLGKFLVTFIALLHSATYSPKLFAYHRIKFFFAKLKEIIKWNTSFLGPLLEQSNLRLKKIWNASTNCILKDKPYMAKERFSCLQDKSAIEIHIDFMYKKPLQRYLLWFCIRKGQFTFQ